MGCVEQSKAVNWEHELSDASGIPEPINCSRRALWKASRAGSGISGPRCAKTAASIGRLTAFHAAAPLAAHLARLSVNLPQRTCLHAHSNGLGPLEWLAEKNQTSGSGIRGARTASAAKRNRLLTLIFQPALLWYAGLETRTNRPAPQTVETDPHPRAEIERSGLGTLGQDWGPLPSRKSLAVRRTTTAVRI